MDSYKKPGNRHKNMTKMKIQHGPSNFWRGVSINLTGDDVATAIDAYLVAHGVHVSGPRTVTVDGKLVNEAEVYVDPSGFVIADGEKISGRGPNADEPR